MKESEDYILTKKMVRQKYNNKCYRCGAKERTGGYFLHVTHILPRKEGGTDELKNLVLTCDDCKKYVSESLDDTYAEIPDSTFDDMEKYCIAKFKKTKFIHPYSIISSANLQRLISLKKQTSLITVMDTVESVSSYATKYIKVERVCSQCNSTEYDYCSKTTLSELINEKGKEFLCKICAAKKKEQENKAYEERLAIRENEKEQCSKHFIDAYLDPNKYWNEGIKPYLKVNEMKLLHNRSDEKLISNHIKAMDYSEFLKTPYWKAIAEYKRNRADMRCELCNSVGLLNVHHRTYVIHGNELYNMDDLIVLCQDCHSKFHDKKEAC